MKRILAVIFAFVVVARPSGGQSGSDAVQVKGAAEIVKIDAKKQVLQVRELVEPSSTPAGGRRGGGGGGGGRGSGGGIGFPGGGRYPGGGGTASKRAKEYKVFVTKDTLLKIQDITYDFTYLHVGDRIGVSGTPKGSKSDVEATTITRDLR